MVPLKGICGCRFVNNCLYNSYARDNTGDNV